MKLIFLANSKAKNYIKMQCTKLLLWVHTILKTNEEIFSFLITNIKIISFI